MNSVIRYDLQYRQDRNDCWWSSNETTTTTTTTTNNNNHNHQLKKNNVAVSEWQDVFKEEYTTTTSTNTTSTTIVDGKLNDHPFVTVHSSFQIVPPPPPHHHHHHHHHHHSYEDAKRMVKQEDYDFCGCTTNKTFPDTLPRTAVPPTPLTTTISNHSSPILQLGTICSTSSTDPSGVADATTTTKNTTSSTSSSSSSSNFIQQDTITTNNLVDLPATPLQVSYAASASAASAASASSASASSSLMRIMTMDSPNDFDILCGRGKPIQKHLGNILLRKLVDLHMNSYISASRKQRKRLAEELLQAMKTKNMRFLKVFTNKMDHYHNNNNYYDNDNPQCSFQRKQKTNTNTTTTNNNNNKGRQRLLLWIEITDNDAKEKIAHCFRSRLP